MKIHLRYGFQHFSTPIPQDCGKPVENPYIALHPETPYTLLYGNLRHR